MPPQNRRPNLAPLIAREHARPGAAHAARDTPRRPGLEQIPWFYDALMAWTDRAGLRRWRQKLIGRARGRTLEVGCGTGRNLPFYGEQCTVVACDPFLQVLIAARAKAPGVPLVVAEAEALPFRRESFDSVVSSLVFCSVDAPDQGLREIARTLQPSGRLLMMEHVRHDSRWKAWIQDRIQPLWTRVSGGCRPNRPTEKTVSDAGFAIEKRRARGAMRLLVARLQDCSSPHEEASKPAVCAEEPKES